MSEERATPAGRDFVIDERLRPPDPGEVCRHSALLFSGGVCSCLLCGKTLPTTAEQD